MTDVGGARRWREIQRKIGKMGESYVKVGVLADKGGAAEIAPGFTLVDVANAHEFGTDTLPERSFLRRTVAEKQSEIAAFTAKLGEQIVAGRLTEVRALELLGAMTAGKVKEFIVSGAVTPDITDATKARKQSTKVLVDTGALVGVIAFEVSST